MYVPIVIPFISDDEETELSKKGKIFVLIILLGIVIAAMVSFVIMTQI